MLSYRILSTEILIYPNSGEKYENIHKTWKGKKEFNLSSIKNWLDESPDIIGGCCRVGVKEINYIKSLLREWKIKISIKME